MIDLKQEEKVGNLSVFEEISEHAHEQIVYCYDENTGLKAIIGIHNTVLGPALGGTRMWNYKSEKEAFVDVLRLSRGMTFKASLSGLNLGGGKAVIIGDAKKLKSEALLRRFGRYVESLHGKYVTAEDVNMNPDDMEYISMETRYVTGLSEKMGGSGDPSPYTAYGVYMGMKACAKAAYGNESLTGKAVAVQGVGHVGYYLVKHLVEEGARVIVTDIYEDKVRDVSRDFKVEVVDQDGLYNSRMDIYAPCALGATVNDDTLNRMHCDIIAGAANNQLEDEKKHGKMLMEKGIIYAPDFMINAGGLINVGLDYLGNYSRERVFKKVERIYNTVLDIIHKSKEEKIPSQEAAIRLATQRINDIGKVKLHL
ncbi:MAG: Glu/Leu/Phe/Val dehydrogenase [Cyclobacteriaceae bacterium]|nr:Glu/Leu/Phe/Val dehydrogenase [Cyclobacteriaceae bacterium]